MRKPMGIFGLCMLHSLLSGLITAVVVMIGLEQSLPQTRAGINWFFATLPGTGLAIGAFVALLLTPLSGAVDSSLKRTEK